MRTEEEIKKAYALTAKAADDTKDEQPFESATAFVLREALGWVLEKEHAEDVYEDLEEEFEELKAEIEGSDE